MRDCYPSYFLLTGAMALPPGRQFLWYQEFLRYFGRHCRFEETFEKRKVQSCLTLDSRELIVFGNRNEALSACQYTPIQPS